MWSDEGLLEIDRTLPEGAETSSVSEISSHVCESFFMSPENTLECEQPIRKVYQSLSSAVDGLLEMALDSTKQVRPMTITEASGGVEELGGCYVTTVTARLPILIPTCRLQRVSSFLK